MSRLLGRVVSGVALAALLLGAREARAQQNNGEDLLVLAYMVGPPSVALLLFDTAMIVSLAGDGTARRGFAINGVVFSGLNGLMALSALSVAQANRNGSNTYLPLTYAALALSVASTGLSIYALIRGRVPAPGYEAPPPASPGPPARSPVRTPGPQLDFAPYFAITPGGSLSGGGALSGRW
ncbi:MAG: hypothetical protein ACYC8T_09150 [Myxococcaceae bacterium]